MAFDTTIKDALVERIDSIEKQFDADVGFYYGEISLSYGKPFRDFIETRKADAGRPRLALFLNTPGGTAEAAEKMVEIMRFHYNEVYFVVPDFAFSAGTILCMSGDKIFMDYSSSLGPIDPQVFNGKELVPALGYLDKLVLRLLQLARDNKISEAEFLILKDQDLATLSRYEQARDLTVTLLKRWLVQYKFKDWKTHRTDAQKKGQDVTPTERVARAEEIAKQLGDSKVWHSHGRTIGVTTLKSLRLEIDDYSQDAELRGKLRSYNDLLTDYVVRLGHRVFMHSRNYF